MKCTLCLTENLAFFLYWAVHNGTYSIKLGISLSQRGRNCRNDSAIARNQVGISSETVCYPWHIQFVNMTKLQGNLIFLRRQLYLCRLRLPYQM